MKMKTSKGMRSETLCAWHGGKLVRASKRTRRYAGVWTNGYELVILDRDMQTHRFNIPTGLIMKGVTGIALS